MYLYLDELERKAKRLRTVELTLQSLLAYLFGLSLLGVVTWGYAVATILRQHPEFLSWDEPGGFLRLG